ncbi:MAG TPA: type II toxin-antitoxin system RelE/ParE family toxin [Bacteroidota bacterium]|nr:type II toxin-antitoxin system RelE/ParE family toxin [Bacteroidota bacterium]
MSHLTYNEPGNLRDKPLVWLHGEIKTPPPSRFARVELGFLLRRLQRGERLSMPSSRPMSSIGTGCHELRVVDQGAVWRLVYRIDGDAIVILEIFQKKTAKTPKSVIKLCKRRIRLYDSKDK